MANHAAIAVPTTTKALRVATTTNSFGSLTAAASSAAPLLQATTLAVALTIFVLGLQGALRGAPATADEQEVSKPPSAGFPKPAALAALDGGAFTFYYAGRQYVITA